MDALVPVLASFRGKSLISSAPSEHDVTSNPLALLPAQDGIEPTILIIHMHAGKKQVTLRWVETRQLLPLLRSRLPETWSVTPTQAATVVGEE